MESERKLAEVKGETAQEHVPSLTPARPGDGARSVANHMPSLRLSLGKYLGWIKMPMRLGSGRPG